MRHIRAAGISGGRSVGKEVQSISLAGKKKVGTEVSPRKEWWQTYDNSREATGYTGLILVTLRMSN